MSDRELSAERTLLGALQCTVYQGAELARVRLELLELEILDERARIGAIVAQGVKTSLSAVLTIQFTALLIVAASWETPWRLHAISLLVLLGLCTTAVAWRSLRRLRHGPRRPVAAALRELDSLLSSQDAVSDEQR